MNQFTHATVLDVLKFDDRIVIQMNDGRDLSVAKDEVYQAAVSNEMIEAKGDYAFITDEGCYEWPDDATDSLSNDELYFLLNTCNIHLTNE